MRASRWPVAVVAVAAILILWAQRDIWVDPLALPYPDRPSSDPPAVPAQGNLTALFSAGDYPIEALRREEQGTAAVELVIDERGRVRECTIVESSGSTSLDSATCNILRRRARFAPATDSMGNPVEDRYSQRITWRLEG